MYLEDFNLAGGRVEVLCVLSIVSLGESVELDPEGDSFLPTVLSGSELCADAVHLQTDIRKKTSNVIKLMHLMWTFSGMPDRWHNRGLMCVYVSYLHKNRGSFVHIPQELCRVKLRGVSLRLDDPH